ncbi:hypothetical protein QTN25_006765 [Entamoeba marina]
MTMNISLYLSFFILFFSFISSVLASNVLYDVDNQLQYDLMDDWSFIQNKPYRNAQRPYQSFNTPMRKTTSSKLSLKQINRQQQQNKMQKSISKRKIASLQQLRILTPVQKRQLNKQKKIHKKLSLQQQFLQRMKQDLLYSKQQEQMRMKREQQRLEQQRNRQQQYIKQMKRQETQRRLAFAQLQKRQRLNRLKEEQRRNARMQEIARASQKEKDNKNYGENKSK